MPKALKIFTVFFAAFVICAGGSVRGQEIRVDTIKVNKTKIIKIIKVMTVPKFILELSGGYYSGAMELTGHNGGFSREDLVNGKNFGARNGFGVNLTGKLPLNKKGAFWLDITAGFARFQSDLFAKNNEEGSTAYNSFNGGIGLEYNFTPYHKLKYFFGGNPLVSVITGKMSLVNPDNNRVDIKVKPAVRFGYTVFTGIEYAFEKNFGVNLGFRFTHANLIGKKTTDPGTDPTETELNDGSTTSDNPVEFGGWKQFAYVQAYAGISYFFGVKINRYKLP